MTTFTSGAVLALTLDQDDRLTFVGSGSCTVTPTYGSSWVIRLDAPGTVIGPFRQNVSLSITTTRDGSYTTDNYGDQPTYVTATTNSVTGGIEVSAGGTVVTGTLASGAWAAPPSIFRLLLNGTGTVTLDSRDAGGVITPNVFSQSLNNAVNDIAFQFAGNSTISIRATLTGTANAKVI